MSVQQYTPQEQSIPKKNTPPISITHEAIVHLEKQILQHDAEGIIFNVKTSGCSGYKYQLDLLMAQNEEAIPYIFSPQLTVYILPKTLSLLKGTHIDLIKKGINYQLDFSNPNATASCGCGESFTIHSSS
jgi:iron-sulfur cluster assembly accessory protein